MQIDSQLSSVSDRDLLIALRDAIKRKWALVKVQRISVVLDSRIGKGIVSVSHKWWFEKNRAELLRRVEAMLDSDKYKRKENEDREYI